MAVHPDDRDGDDSTFVEPEMVEARVESPWVDQSGMERLTALVRFVGPGRVAAGIGAALVLAAVGWWLFRPPSLPAEAGLARAQAAVGVTTGPGGSVLLVGPVVTSPTTAAAPMFVHVAGAVATSGVYEMPAGARVVDALAAAGGPTADADVDALNLAAPVLDGDRIVVPVPGDDPAVGGHVHAAGDASSGVPAGPIDLNSATVAELETLPGVGPATAAAIIDERDSGGPFAAVDDLERVRGIGPAKLEALRDLVTT